MKMLSIPVTQEHIDAAVGAIAASGKCSVCQCCIVYQALLAAGLRPKSVSHFQWWRDDDKRFLLGPECAELTVMSSAFWRTVTPRTITASKSLNNMPRIKRPHSIVVKVTAEERDAFYRASSKLKLSGSDWLRGLGMVEVMDKPVELEEPIDMGNPITEPVPPIQPFVEATPLAMKHNPVSQPEPVTSKGGVSGIISGIKDWISPKPQAKPSVESPAQPEFKNGDLVAKVPPEWGTIQPAADAPKPPTAEARMYDVIEKRNGRAAADAWMNARKAPKTSPAPVVIGEPQVPGHLRAFYDNLVKNQGQAQADFWLLTNSKGVKLAP